MPEAIAQRIVEAPVVAQEPRSDVKHPTIGTTEKTLDEAPYIKELFKMGEASGHFEMPKLIGEINEFVLSEIDRQHLKHDRETYEDIVNGFVKRLNIPEGLDLYAKTERLAELIRIQKKLINDMLEREELLKKDPSEMTSAQLRQVIELKEKNV